MIYVFAGLRAESAPLKTLENECVKVITTGTGKINAAFEVGRALGPGGTRESHSGDFIVNIGSAASSNLEGLFLVNKIEDTATGRKFYPDLMRVTAVADLNQAPLITSDDVVKDAKGEVLYDMEASGIFAAAGRIISPDRIIILKAVSDKGDGSPVTAKEITGLIEKYMETFKKIIDSLQGSFQKDSYDPWEDINKLQKKLYLTKSLELQSAEILKFANSLGEDGAALMEMEINSFSSADNKLSKTQTAEVIRRVRDRISS